MTEYPTPRQSFPPFPPLKWDGYFWTARVVLPSWRGFQSRQGPYGAKRGPAESDGTARLSVSPPDGTAEHSPSVQQANAFAYLLTHDEAVRDAVVAAILEEYPALRANLLAGGFVDESELPAVETPEQLRSHVGLSTVHVLRTAKGGAAYVGFEFGCSWDEEHGLGVMTHQGRIVEAPHMRLGKVSGADVASEEWLAEEDAASPE